MAQPTQALDRTIVVVDVVGFTAPDRNPLDRLAVRQGMYEVLKTAFAECDVDFDSCAREDRGDGALFLLPLGTTKSQIADRLPDRIAVALRRYNHTRTPQAQMRLRVSLNSGEVLNDGNGWVGVAVDTAFRILDAQLAKDAFAESGRTIAVITSQRFFTDVIEQDPGLLPELYSPIPVSVKTFTGTAYLRLHGEVLAPITKPPPLVVEAAEDLIIADLDSALLELIPRKDLAGLHHHLTRMEVPHLAVMMSRALGPAVPLPRLEGIRDAWGAFQLLTDFNAGPDGIPPAVTFLRLLAEHMEGEQGTVVAGWIADQARALRLGPALGYQRESRPPIPERPHLHLIIMLEPVSGDPTRCTLAFWRQDDPEVWPPALGGVREIGIEEVEFRVDDVILETEAFWSGQTMSASVEFLLPRTLINLPVQRWAKEHDTGQPQPLRYGYRLGIRSLERMRAKHWHRAWNVRWDSMVKDPSADRLHYSGCAESEDHPIDAILSNEHWIGLVLANPPSPRVEPGSAPDELTSALRSGLPVVLWHPDVEPEKLRELLDWVLSAESGFIELPDRRKLANSGAAVPFKNFLAHDLVVMWDDPKRVIVLDQPLIPTRL
ncbi:VMAP-C domain-containing protein [Amycolatopsis speibonae]|uniref:Guanylate cyclase domain-containing protein n=1 Tax=Amycolatopsis speibonae TaxID=1450224 RepID=A0ABV7P9S0_9PSEU